MKTNGRLWKVLSAGILVLAIAGSAAPATLASGTGSLKPAAPTVVPVVCQVSSPNPGEVNTLTAITSVPVPLSQGDTTMWAVGHTRSALGATGQVNTLIMVNKAGTWGVVPSPSYPGANYLTGISGTSSHDVWAVGYVINGLQELPLVLHYDGKIWKFALYPDPSMRSAMPGIGTTRLLGVTALSATEVVAVGYKTGHLYGYQPLALYYNGTYWKEMNFPAPGFGVRVTGVTGKALNDLWAIATYGEDNAPGTLSMLYRFDGNTWQLMAKTPGNFFSVAMAGDRVFAAGHADISSKEESLAIMYDKVKGDSFRVKTFNKNVDNNYLLGLAAAGDSVYAVGYSGKLGVGKEVTPLVLQYDGATFIPLYALAPTNVARLLGVTMDHGNMWAVGDMGKHPVSLEDSSSTLVETTLCTTNQ